MEHIDIIKYFAKFPLKAGVLKNFKVDGTDIEGYTALVDYITNLTPHSVIPTITDFIITQNDKTLSDRLRSINGWFMLIETGGISVGSFNDARVRDSKFSIQITIAHHWDGRTLDTISEALLSDKALSLQNTLISELKKDDAELCASKRWLDNPYQLEPIEPFLLFESIGWQLTITRNYNSLL
jgi:hypothetical protein